MNQSIDEQIKKFISQSHLFGKFPLSLNKFNTIKINDSVHKLTYGNKFITYYTSVTNTLIKNINDFYLLEKTQERGICIMKIYNDNIPDAAIDYIKALAKRVYTILIGPKDNINYAIKHNVEFLSVVDNSSYINIIKFINKYFFDYKFIVFINSNTLLTQNYITSCNLAINNGYNYIFTKKYVTLYDSPIDDLDTSYISSGTFISMQLSKTIKSYHQDFSKSFSVPINPKRIDTPLIMKSSTNIINDDVNTSNNKYNIVDMFYIITNDPFYNNNPKIRQIFRSDLVTGNVSNDMVFNIALSKIISNPECKSFVLADKNIFIHSFDRYMKYFMSITLSGIFIKDGVNNILMVKYISQDFHINNAIPTIDNMKNLPDIQIINTNVIDPQKIMKPIKHSNINNNVSGTQMQIINVNKRDKNIIQSLWVGCDLTLMEITCINSFIENGHEFHLYTYGNIQNIPWNCIIKDANEIIPQSKIFYHTESAGNGKGSLGAFSDIFRYKLIYDRGNYWVDMDMICTKHFDFNQPYVFSSEIKYIDGKEIGQIINAGIIKAPKKSEFAKYCYQTCLSRDVTNIKWGEIGPALVRDAIFKFRLQQYVQPYDAFCPISYFHMDHITEPHKFKNISNNTFSIHLWNEFWRRFGLDKNIPKKQSLYDRFVKKYSSLKILVSSTQYPTYGGAATNAYYIIKHLRANNYKTAGLFFNNPIVNADIDNISGIYCCANPDDNIKKLIIKYLGGTPNIILAKNFVAPKLCKQMFPNAYVVYLVSGISGADNYYLETNDYSSSATDILAKLNQNTIKYFINDQEIKTLDIVDNIVINSDLAMQFFNKIYPQYSKKIYPHVIDTTDCVKTKITDNNKIYDIILVCSNFKRIIKNNIFLKKILSNQIFNGFSKCIIGSNSNIFGNIPNTTIIDLIPNNEVIKYLCKSKILLFPSLFDANPNTVREAYQVKCIPLVSNGIGYYESFPKALVCTSFSEDEWTEKIINLLENYNDYQDIHINFGINNLNGFINYINNEFIHDLSSDFIEQDINEFTNFMP